MLTDTQDGTGFRVVRPLTILLLFVLPALILLVSSGGSAPYHLVALVAIATMFRRYPASPRALMEEERLACIGFGIFVITILISFVESGMTYDGFRELDVLLRPLWAIPIMYLLIRIRPPEGLLWFGVSLGAVLAGLNAIYEVTAVDQYIRADGATSAVTYGNTSLIMGVISALGIPYFRRLGAVYTAVPAAALLLGTIGSFLSGSRGGWIAIPALTLLLMWHYWLPAYRRFAIAGVLTLTAVASLAVLLPQTGVKDRIDRAVSHVELYTQNPAAHGHTSEGQRLELWRAAWTMFSEKPIFGGGIGHNFHRFVNERVAAGDYNEAIAVQTMPHNVFLDVMAMRGIVGLVGLLALWLMLAYVFLAAARNSSMEIRALGTAGLALILGYAIFGLTDSVMDYGPPLVFFCIYSVLIVHFIAQARLDKQSAGVHPNSEESFESS